MTNRRAVCSCGKLSLTTHGEPIRISVCHCLACQQRTGSAFGVQAQSPGDRVDIEGISKAYVRTGDSGQMITFHFCPDCGSTAYCRLDPERDVVRVPVGAFADPQFPAPSVSVYESVAHDWVGLPNEIERFP